MSMLLNKSTLTLNGLKQQFVIPHSFMARSFGGFFHFAWQQLVLLGAV